MKNAKRVEKAWKTFEKTGSVMDYLDYAYAKRDLYGDTERDRD